MKQAWDAETVGFHSDDGKRFLRDPKKEERFPQRSPVHAIDETGSRAGKRGAWCSVKPSAIPRLFALIDAPHPDLMDMYVH